MGEEAMKILDIDHIELYVGDAIAAAQSLCTAYGFRVYGHGGPDTGLPGQRSILLGQGDLRILLTSGLKEDHPASQFVARHGDGVAVTAFRTDNAAIAYTDVVAAGGSVLQPDLTRRAGQIDDFLAWHDGAGVQHVAFLTKDIVRAVRTITGRGTEFAQTPSSYYDMLAARLGTPDIPVEALRPLGILVDSDHWGQMYQIFAKSTHIRRTFFLELIDRHGARTFGTNNIPALYAAKERELAAVRDTAGTLPA